MFDRRHVLNFYWFYDLPFGPGQKWSTGNWADKVFGGWYNAGIVTASSGSPVCVYTFANYGALTGTNSSCAIPIRGTNFGNSVHKSAGSGGIGTNGDPAEGGSGLNLYANPEAVFNNFRFPLMTRDTRFGFGVLRGLPRWNLDLSLGKRTAITESVKLALGFDFINVLNHRELNDPTNDFNLDLTNPTAFGVFTSQFGSPRTIQFGFRVEF
ncbi:MAG: hypothetical protein HY314_15090 [Acidobacteria bacterium]|nr:hypothetical protein [Acidobacteriota bacterium]